MLHGAHSPGRSCQLEIIDRRGPRLPFLRDLGCHFCVLLRWRTRRCVCHDRLCPRSVRRWVPGGCSGVLEKHKLVFDLGLGYDAVDQGVAIAKRFPGLTIVLNHCGELAGPVRRPALSTA